MYKKVIKPVFDICSAVLAVLLLLPLFILVSIAIKLESKGPVFFKQERLGKNGSVFQIFKFRSMVYNQSKFRKSVKIYENDPRITKVGKFIRRTSIDEIPQLFNIIRGEMSFIGPRPPLTYFPKKFEEYNDFENQRFLIKPGISGLAQIRCREIHDWDINISIDVEYVKNYSFIYDTKLFLLSLITFFKTDNIYRKN
jgi:undecaprenyl phosphate N,N'-diacetylbacillosamine 1-phosphate transferase